MVYVDLLVIEDLLMNYVIITTVGIILNRITKSKKVFLSSVIGTIPLIFLFIIENKIYLFSINLIFATIMSIIAFNYKDIIYSAKNIIYMYFTSIFFAGSLYLINTFFLPQINSYCLNTFFLIIISPIITYIYVKCIKNIKTNYSNYYLVDIYFKDKPKITINTFLDTGNLLKDPYNHKSIILVNKKIINYNNKKIILVPYNTINDSGLIKCISPDKIYIHKVGYRKNVLIGLINKQLIEGADGILNKQLLERT